MHVHRCGLSTMSSLLHVATTLFADILIVALERVDIQFTPVIHVTTRELHVHRCPQVCEVSSVSKVYDRYPKSTISSGSSAGPQKARKLSIPAPIAAKLHTGAKCWGRFSSQLLSARLVGRAALRIRHGFLHDCQAQPFGQVQTFYTTPSSSANTKSQLHKTQQLQNR